MTMPPTATPVSIPTRPFAVYPPTNMMNPDGFFIANLGNQFIEAHIRNESSDTLQNVHVYIESLSDPGITLMLEHLSLGDIPAGASVPIRFRADFSEASAGITFISFIVESDDYEFKREIKKIFVTKLYYHKPSKTATLIAPEGRMLVGIEKAIQGPRCWCHRMKDPRGHPPFILLPTELSCEWIPDPPYEGKHGPIPYSDPLHKGLIWLIVFLGALAVAALYDYFSDGTLDGGMVSVSGGDIPPGAPSPTDAVGSIDTSSSCCDEIISRIPQKNDDISVGASGFGDWIETGLYLAAGPVASVVAGLSDDEDPYWRGQEATTPLEDELTVSEKVRAIIQYPVPPGLGQNYQVHVKWLYERTTSGNSYQFEVEEKRENIHYLKSYEVKAPEKHDRRSGPLTICARFQKPDGTYYYGDDLYVFGVLVSEYGAVRCFELMDHGMELDEKANDSWFCGGYGLDAKRIHAVVGQPSEELDLPGTWYLFVFAQDISTGASEKHPTSKTLGGIVLTSQMKLSFEEPCTLDHDAVILVI